MNLHNILFRLSLLPFCPKEIVEYVAEHYHHCSACVRVFHQKFGGRLVLTVKDDWSDGRVSGHFMNLLDNGKLVDLMGREAHYISKNKVDFGNGAYTVCAIVGSWEEFEINSYNDLIDLHKQFHEKIQEGKL